MKGNLFKISEEAAKSIASYFASSEFQSKFKEIKESGSDNGTFRMVISTDQVDRHGEVVSQDGWMTENYMKNPVVLWAHDSWSIPVGITDKLITEIQDGVKRLVAEGRFASHEFAQVLRKTYDEGMLNTSSVGFIPFEYEGNTITKAELLEWSFVSVPANPFALASRGFDINMLIAKGVIRKEEADDIKEGDEIVTPPANAGDEDDVTVDNEEVSDVENTEEGLELTFSNGEKKTFKFAESYKAGRVLSKANRSKIEAAYSALEEVLAADADEAEEGKGQPEGTEKNVDMDAFALTLLKGVQDMDTFMGDILANAKKLRPTKA